MVAGKKIGRTKVSARIWGRVFSAFKSINRSFAMAISARYFLVLVALALGSAVLCSAAPTFKGSLMGLKPASRQVKEVTATTAADDVEVEVITETEEGDAIEDPANTTGVVGAVNPGAQAAINSGSPAEPTAAPAEPAVVEIEEDDDDEDVVEVAEEPPVFEEEVVTLPDSVEGSEEFFPTPVPDDAVCFPSHATVQMEDGTHRKMEDLSVGDSVSVGNGQFSSVFMFTHKLSAVQNEFVSIESASGITLSLTSGHYLYVNGDLAPAATVVVGDNIELASGASDTVAKIGRVTAKGLYNPQTLHGDIVVNGVRASTYTTAIEPSVAHTLLAPLRAIFESGAVRDPTFGLLEGGAGVFTSVLKAF